jgi:uncharacterized protein YacL
MLAIVRLSGALLGTFFGFALGLLILDRFSQGLDPALWPAVLVAVVVASLLFGYLAIPYATIYPTRWAVGRVADSEASTFALGVSGIVLGLVIGVLVGIPLAKLDPPWGTVLPIVVALVLAVAMSWLLLLKRESLLRAMGSVVPGTRRRMSQAVVVDTSAVIDGRIVDIARTGFILGELVAPRFVLDELQRIADSPDTQRRNRGRRGLEMLAALQKDAVTPITISEETYPEVDEVDAKLLAYAREHDAAILTNDFNLNRVAELQGIRVLNINELANAVKAVVHPGEDMTVRIIQPGKEAGQGVGYLDDGTMIVVEGGSEFMDHEVPVTVTRVLQTVAGRMIFAQPRPGS